MGELKRATIVVWQEETPEDKFQKTVWIAGSRDMAFDGKCFVNGVGATPRQAVNNYFEKIEEWLRTTVLEDCIPNTRQDKGDEVNE